MIGMICKPLRAEKGRDAEKAASSIVVPHDFWLLLGTHEADQENVRVKMHLNCS